MGEPILPWANGTASDLWVAGNCDECERYDGDADGADCDIWKAIMLSTADEDAITPEIARRMGWSDERPQGYWPCAEFVPAGTPIPEIPAVEFVRAAGVPRLPGFEP
jgi:hypothetical protein